MKKPIQLQFLLIFALLQMPQAALASEKIGFADSSVCPSPRVELPKMLLEASNAPLDEQDTIIEGDEMVTDANNTNLQLIGNSQIIQGKRGVFADKITYDEEQGTATASGNVRYYTLSGDEIKTDSMQLDVDTFIGETGRAEMHTVKRGVAAKPKTTSFVEDFTFFAPFFNRTEADEEEDDRPIVESRVYADSIDIEGQDFQRLRNARFTRCPEGQEDVFVTGEEIELDHASGVGYAKNVRIKFKGVPILYAPRLSFPINDERKTGVLAPSAGTDDDSGTILSVPYYFNLAPNYDATLRTTYMSKRGVQLYGEFRHMTENGKGILKGEYLPGDDAFEGEDRYAYGLDYQQRYSNGWSSLVDLQDVSDTQYLNDFRNDIEITSTTHLRQQGELRFDGERLNTNIRLSKYETVNDAFASSKPYDRLPQVFFNVKPWEVGAFQLGLDSEFVSYDHEDNDLITGTRLNVEPYIKMPYEPIYGYVKPKLSVKHISYSLDNTTGEESPSISAPKAVIDSGLYFERDASYRGEAYLHTLEPRLMYVYVGEEDQTGFPNFDTSAGSISSYNYLFRDDRFFGGDRVGDDHHIALGVTTRFINEETGSEKMRASIGQLYYLEDREVSLIEDDDALEDDDTLTDSKSDIFAEANATLNENFSVNSFVRWDQAENETRNFNFGLDYDAGPRRRASLDYFLTKDSTEDVRVSLDWPLAARWQLGYSQLYSLEESEVRSSSVALVYDGCCWALGLSANRLLQSDGEYRNSILATFELDGLGSIQSAVR